MRAGAPKFRRRKAERPDEIVAAALEVFVEKGFAAARLEEIAARAGVSKGAVYLYFETKEALFRAVVARAIAPNVSMLKAMVAAHPGPFAELVRGATMLVAGIADTAPLGGVLKMVVGEARNFPELARVWHDELVSHAMGAMSQAIATAQQRGEVKAGDPRIYAVQMIAPLLVGVLWRETFVPVGAPALDLKAVMAQHAETLLHGMLTEGARA